MPKREIYGWKKKSLHISFIILYILNLLKNLLLAEIKRILLFTFHSNRYLQLNAQSTWKTVRKWQSRSSTSILHGSNWFVRWRPGARNSFRLIGPSYSHFQMLILRRTISVFSYPGSRTSLFLIRRLVDTERLFPRERKGSANDTLRNPYFSKFVRSSAATPGKNRAITVNRRTSREIGVN